MLYTLFNKLFVLWLQIVLPDTLHTSPQGQLQLARHRKRHESIQDDISNQRWTICINLWFFWYKNNHVWFLLKVCSFLSVWKLLWCSFIRDAYVCYFLHTMQFKFESQVQQLFDMSWSVYCIAQKKHSFHPAALAELICALMFHHFLKLYNYCGFLQVNAVTLLSEG